MEMITQDMMMGIVIGAVGMIVYLKIRIMLEELNFQTWKETQLDLNQAKRELTEYEHKLEIQTLQSNHEKEKLEEQIKQCSLELEYYKALLGTQSMEATNDNSKY